MPQPASWSLRTVQAKYIASDGSGTPLTGDVEFRMSNPVTVASISSLPTTIVKKLEADGGFTVDLPTNNDPDIAPQGTTWEVHEHIAGGRAKYSITVPTGTGTLQLADLAPVIPATVLNLYVRSVNGITADPATGNIVIPGIVDDVLEFASLAAFPVTGAAGILYIAIDTNLQYRWGGASYVQLAGGIANTDALAEGTTNLYHTAARVRAVVLTGLSLAVATAITAADTVLAAFGKLQAQLTANLATLTAHTGNASNPHGVTAAQTGAIPTTEKGAAGGVATLDGGGKVPAGQLPSFVDDVLEYANLAALLGTGEAGKIYVTLDTNFAYRWSGSAYQRIVESPGSTDALTEGATNLYFTVARVRAVVLTGLSLASSAAIAATDTILQALGQLQAQITLRAPAGRNINTTAPLQGGGDLTADRTLSILAATTVAAGSMSGTDKAKLDGVAPGATANATDAQLRDRATHTGTTPTAGIADDAVTFAKMQNINTAKLIGRSTAASGDPEEIAVGAGLTLAAGTLSASASGGAPALWQKDIFWVHTNGNSGIATTGIGNVTVSTQMARGVYQTNFRSESPRSGIEATTSTAGSSAFLYTGSQHYMRGSVAGHGGFKIVMRFVQADPATVAQARCFYGVLDATGVIGNVNPSTLLNIFGMGADSGDANMQIMHNDGAGVATKVDLGVNFPANTAYADIYEATFECLPNATSISYTVLRVDSGFTATGSISTNLPVNTLSLGFQMWRNNGTTALLPCFEFMFAYSERNWN